MHILLALEVSYAFVVFGTVGIKIIVDVGSLGCNALCCRCRDRSFGVTLNCKSKNGLLIYRFIEVLDELARLT